MKFCDDTHLGLNWGIDRLSNRKNAQMNDLMAIDHATRDWLDDTDLMLPRWTQEFPRLAENMTRRQTIKDSRNPWGSKRQPVYVEPFLDENLLLLSGPKK